MNCYENGTCFGLKRSDIVTIYALYNIQYEYDFIKKKNKE